MSNRNLTETAFWLLFVMMFALFILGLAGTIRVEIYLLRRIEALEQKR